MATTPQTFRHTGGSPMEKLAEWSYWRPKLRSVSGYCQGLY